MTARDVIGIDLSGRCWRASHLAKWPHRAELVEHFRLEGTLPERVGQLKAYMKERRAEGAAIALALDPRDCLVKTLRLPVAESTGAARMLGFETERHLPSDADGWRWSSAVMNTEGTSSTVMLSAAKADSVAEAISALEAAGLVPGLMISGQAALAAAAKRSGFLGAGDLSAVISVSEEAIDLEVIRDGALLYSSRAPVAWFKRETVLALSSVKEVPRSFVIIDEDNGDESVVEKIADEAREFCASVRVFGPIPALTRAFGAAAIIADGSERAIDFLPDKGAPFFREKALAAAFAAMLVILAAGAGVVANDLLTLNGISKEITRLGDDRTVAEAMIKESGSLAADLKTLEEIKGASAPEFLETLVRLTELTPEDTYLTGLEYGKDKIMVDGVSAKASGLFMKLSSSGFAEDINYEGPVTRGQDGKERFRIKFRKTGGEGDAAARTGP